MRTLLPSPLLLLLLLLVLHVVGGATPSPAMRRRGRPPLRRVARVQPPHPIRPRGRGRQGGGAEMLGLVRWSAKMLLRLLLL